MSSWKGTLDLLTLMLSPTQTRASRVYDLLGDRHGLGEKSLYLNLGYWDGATTMDGASQRLAEKLGETADLRPEDEQLDCGFGFADQDMYWIERFGPKRIVGLNITASQVKIARERVAARGLADRIELREGSATRMPVADASFDKVTALETAFHYVTREDFFREAFRALRPGGRLATADILPQPQSAQNLFLAAGDRLSRQFWQIPAANIYDRAEYKRKLEAIGFVDVKIESIRDRVYAGLLAFSRPRLRDADVRKRFNPLLRLLWSSSFGVFAGPSGPDYVLASAVKPR